ncbi:hypothetical protein HPB50_028211 [Hyalomma asiaticum]|nr:hypothetical protein HPB50_028211 [Hyalomma asiaticum]
MDLDQQDIISALLQRAPVKSVRRLGTSENVRIVFATETAPEYIVLGYTRYRVFKYIECPRQCSKCQRFGHVEVPVGWQCGAHAAVAITTDPPVQPSSCSVLTARNSMNLHHIDVVHSAERSKYTTTG